MVERANSLLLPGSGPAWAQIAALERESVAHGPLPVEELLRRGQHLSAQAAALRRAVADGSPHA